MSLVVAIMSEHPAGSFRGPAPWGEWQIHPLTDPTVLATDLAVRTHQTSHVLVLSTTAATPAAQMAASTIAASRPDLPVRVLSFPVSPTVLTRAVELVPPGVTTATGVHDAIVAALDTVVWGAWLPTVAKLSRPAPTLRQHVRSWFADANGYLAVHGEPGWVARLPIAELAPERRLRRVPAPGLVASSYDCHAYGELPEAAISALFSMGLAARPTRREPVADVAATWGTAKAVEFVISWPPAPVTLAPTHRCPACEEPVSGGACPFCRVAPVRVGRNEAAVQGVAS
ncbi:hypothetical protein [Nocardioides sp. T2.26MG-1]|uniref:hypothetical protein n=1 Tax=Nocardioides sp. T2.26MG-1 TaxID=3041166 RepID=UPI002477A831|nr:hypothetical protein [Nocardioides sp. T2.26MG-1]CAI9415510.1 hypothetical protein HIDPHFAB_02540 [Nocardioides sp. T2.26MG-1]